MSDENKKLHDSDPAETQEWLEALDAVVEFNGKDRASFLLSKINASARNLGIDSALGLVTPYRNTLTNDEPYPGDLTIEHRIDAINRWNLVIMVLRGAEKAGSLGGHISSASSISRIYEVGFNHHFQVANKQHDGDLVFLQGHSTEWQYARSFLEGRFNRQKLNRFRQEAEKGGLSSYPHPWLMPDYWQFPTVSMGLGLLQAIYQAHFMKYLDNRDLITQGDRHVWYHSGDGEMEEPESRGALALAARYLLDNLTLVVNCNLQCLDGPVFGNGSIVNEFESMFVGCGWHVIKVIWGRQWDDIFARDTDNLILQRMENMPDGEFQNYGAKEGAYAREHFFNSPALKALVEHLDDRALQSLFRDGMGGHDFVKIHSAFVEARRRKGRPTVILIQSIKGFGLGEAAEGLNIAHNAKKITEAQLKAFRDRWEIPVADKDLKKLPYYLPDKNSDEVNYVKARRQALGGLLPQRRQKTTISLKVPPLKDFSALLAASGDREMSITMSLSRFLSVLMKDKTLGKHVVPIIPDECRTFGLEGMFRQYGIYSPYGQKYTPVDKQQLMYYRQAKDGQVMEEGINEAGAVCAWLAAATAYSHHNVPMIPFYIYYSMFGFQRVGDFIWAGGDMRARGFLIGGTAGRTALSGEGLQHNDGHSHIFSAVVPTCVSYDVTYGYELAVVIREGMRRMIEKQEDIFYYLTVGTENYCHPAMPEGVEADIIKGLYLFKKSKAKNKLNVQLLGSGTILREAEAAAVLLEKNHGVNAGVWSATSFTELRRDGMVCSRWNMLNSNKKAKVSHVEQCLTKAKGPVIAASDYIRSFADQIRQWVPARYVVLGTDGFGRSDTREKLREFHEVDRYFITLAALKALVDEGKLPVAKLTAAMKKYGISANKTDPVTV
ncbi:MAG: pyruvate dehydrogenase (acetyl-transferring), homodimeric type [Pseudomonadota bacterium]